MGDIRLKVAIVGISKPLSVVHVNVMIHTLLGSYDPRKDEIISGGAKGVDSFVQKAAKSLGFPVRIFTPKTETWLDFKARNLLIAEECDVLYCITNKTYSKMCYHHGDIHQDHQKTAGCWTMNKAIELNKPCSLFVV